MSGEFEITLGRPGDRRRRREEPSVRILVLADFSGRPGDNPTFAAQPLAIDNVDAAIAGFAPRVRISAVDSTGAARYLALESLEELHPDRLAAAVPQLRELVELARRLDAAPTDARAIAELEALVGAPKQPVAPQPPATPEQSPESDAGTLERLLGQPRGAGGDDRAKQKVRELIESALGPAQRSAPSQRTQDGRQRLAALLNERCRTLLNDPQFRGVERAWRSVQWLASRVEDDRASIHLVDLSKPALAAHLEELGPRLDASPLYGLLAEHPDGKWDVIAADYSFDLVADDVVLLAKIGALAARAGAPFLAHGELGLAGCNDNDLDRPSEWRFADEELGSLWGELRRHPAAGWIALATPRFLLRQPYGAKTDPTERFAFEELPPRPSRDRFLWGNPAFACALLMAQARASGESDVWPSAGGSVDDLPMPIYGDGSGDAIQQPLEHTLGERARIALAERGLVAFSGGRNTNRIAVGPIDSIAAS